MRSWLKVLGVVTAVAVASTALAADHRDAPATLADPAADINDVYAWVEGDNLIFVMTVFPAAGADAKFSDKVQYVLNIDSGPAFGMTLNSKKIICTFDVSQTAQCWVGAEDYVKGDASQAAGITSESSKVQVFAGLRSDPFFFNLDGFKDAVSTVISAAPALAFNEAGCPSLDAATSSVLIDQLQSTNQGADPAVDFFKDLDTLAIVVKVDKTLVTGGDPIVSVWGSTHAAM